MTKNIMTVFPKDKIEKSEILFDANEFHHLPVIDS